MLSSAPTMVVDGPDGALLSVWAKPRASKSRVLGRRLGPDEREALEVALAAPPVDGAANEELLATLSKALGVPTSRLGLTSGASGRLKVVRVRGATAREVVEALGV